MMKRTAAFCTLGCKVNQYETDAIRERFAAAGYEIADFNAPADVYIVNTCTVTNMADRKSRQMLHRAAKKNPGALVTAVGCYAQEAADQLAKDPLVDIVIGNNLKNQIVDIVSARLSARDEAAAGDGMTDAAVMDSGDADHEGSNLHVMDMMHEHTYEEMRVRKGSEHTRAFIKIQDGCNQFCSYCIIPFARGRVRSRRQEDILQEVRDLIAAGYREIVLTGIHISSYGLDFQRSEAGAADSSASALIGEGAAEPSSPGQTKPDETDSPAALEQDYDPFAGSGLINLIEALSQLPGLDRIRLGSLEPRIITEDFLRRLSRIPQVCPHFHLSLQSGCEATLVRMNRHYTPALYLEKCQMIRRYFEQPAITTDVIVGFPGETEEEFAQTQAFLERVAFADMHIFKYSRREGTRAARMPHQVDPQIQTARSDRLLALAARMRADFVAACAGSEQEILIEEQVTVAGESYLTGHTRNYLRCLLALPRESGRPSQEAASMINTIVPGRIREIYDDEFILADKLG